MKLKDAIAQVDKSTKNTKWVCGEELCQELGITSWYSFGEELQGRFKLYWLAPHYCTDTWVGTSVLFLDDVFVALIRQDARKSDKNYHWVSEDAAKTSRRVLQELMQEDDLSFDVISENQMDMDIGDGFTVSYTSQILSKKVIFDGRISDFEGSNRTDYSQAVEEWRKVVVKNDEGINEKVDLDRILVPYRTVSNTDFF